MKAKTELGQRLIKENDPLEIVKYLNEVFEDVKDHRFEKYRVHWHRKDIFFEFVEGMSRDLRKLEEARNED